MWLAAGQWEIVSRGLEKGQVVITAFLNLFTLSLSFLNSSFFTYNFTYKLLFLLAFHIEAHHLETFPKSQFEDLHKCRPHCCQQSFLWLHQIFHKATRHKGQVQIWTISIANGHSQFPLIFKVKLRHFLSITKHQSLKPAKTRGHLLS